MSLTEQDREILLQEIKQIQQTLEASGQTIDPYSTDDGEEESEEYESDGNGSGNWNLYVEEKDDNETSKNFYESLQQNAEDLLYPTSNNHQTSTGNLESLLPVADVLSQTTDNQLVLNKFFQTFQDHSLQSDSLSAFVSMDDTAEPAGIFTPDPLNIQKDSQKRNGSKSNIISSIKNEEGVSTCDVSFPSSIPSSFEKNKNTIAMTNLYIERIFRSYRKNKPKPSPSVAFQGEKFDSRNLRSSANLSTLENLLQVNRQYQEMLLEELKKVQIAMNRNQKAQDELMITAGEKDDNSYSNLLKACLGKFTKPYFKDSDGLGPPDNEDTKEKKRNLIAGSFPKASKAWKHSDNSALEEGVYNNNLEIRLVPILQRLKQIDKDIKNQEKGADVSHYKKRKSNLMQEISDIRNLPREDILKDTTDIDFFKISKNYLPSRDDFECRIHWLNVIHPLINQKKFTKDEDGKLIKLAKKYENHNWELISQELGTNRTPVQCLQRFQRTLNKDMIKTTWNEEDDQKLKEAFKIYGNNWVEVAGYLGDRLSDQCMHRWEKTLNPTIRRGRWTTEEDQLLLAAVERHGAKNWKVVKLEVAGRTDSQCRERYVSSIDPSINWSPFTEGEDIKLLALAKKYGTGKWSKIASEFPDRRDHQVWRRYKQISAEDYHKYRRENLWKKGSVMNYFLHRSSERRDYEIQDLDVSYSPCINSAEARKLKSAKAKLVDQGYSDDDITRRLARMHFDGQFSKPSNLPVDTTKRNPKNITNKKKGEKNKSTKDKKLVSEVTKILAAVDDPDQDLPLVTYEKKQQSDDDGLIRVTRPEYLVKRGRLRTFLNSVDPLDRLRQRCDMSLKKYRQQKTVLSEAKGELDDYEKMISHNLETQQRHIMLAIVEEYRDKMDCVTHTLEEVQTIILKQDELEIVWKKTGTVNVKQTNDSPDVDDVEQTVCENDNKKPTKKRKSAAPKKVCVSDGSEQRGDDQTNTEQSEGAQQPQMDDRLRVFTLLLQALHVDTNGVMRALPESSHLAGSCPTIDHVKSFPNCYPLSPNVASLRGFRSLLLHRRKLGEIVEKHYLSRSPDRSYQNTHTYEALKKRFRSLFMWPAFMATFIPKFIPGRCKKVVKRDSATPSIMGPLVRKTRKNRKRPAQNDSQTDFVESYMQKRRAENRVLTSRHNDARAVGPPVYVVTEASMQHLSPLPISSFGSKQQDIGFTAAVCEDSEDMSE